MSMSTEEDRIDEEDDGAECSDDDGAPLAWDANGEKFELPPEAECWRIKKGTRRGPGEVMYAEDGLPLRIPLGAAIDDLAAAVGDVPGRYRLEALDGRGKLCKGVPGAIVEIRGEPGHRAGGGASSDAVSRNLDTAVTQLGTVAVHLAGSTAHVVTAAGQAGVSRRRVPADPVVVEMPSQEPPPPQPPAAAKPGWMHFVEMLPTVAPALPQIVQVLQAFGVIPPTQGATAPSAAPSNGHNGTHYQTAPTGGG